MSDNTILEIEGLSKKFRNIQAVDDLSLQVFEKDVYGFLGPNGSGKSTTIRMLLTLLSPDSGSITIFGKELFSNRKNILRKVGAFIEKPDFYEYLSAYKNLEILSRYSGLTNPHAKIHETLELVGLSDRHNSKVKTYSKGMKQRLGIAQALLHDPELLILDEPASGLDPSGNRDIRQLIRYLNTEKKKTIILSSHNLAEIELIANRMVIIKKGKKIIDGEVAGLLARQIYLTHFQVDKADEAIRLLQNSRLQIINMMRKESGIDINCKKQLIPEINAFLVNNTIRVDSIRVEQNLEDFFLNVV